MNERVEDKIKEERWAWMLEVSPEVQAALDALDRKIFHAIRRGLTKFITENSDSNVRSILKSAIRLEEYDIAVMARDEINKREEQCKQIINSADMPEEK